MYKKIVCIRKDGDDFVCINILYMMLHYLNYICIDIIGIDDANSKRLAKSISKYLELRSWALIHAPAAVIVPDEMTQVTEQIEQAIVPSNEGSDRQAPFLLSSVDSQENAAQTGATTPASAPQRGLLV